MRKLTYLLFLSFMILSCQQNTNTKKQESGEHTTVNKVESSIQIDENLKNQLKEYNEAMHGANPNPERVLDFIYSDTFTYLKNENPNNYSKEMVIKLFNEPATKLREMATKNNIDYSSRVGEITKKVNEGNKLIYKVQIFLDMKYGMEKHTTGDEILGISLNNGKNWKFLEFDPATTPQILKIKFSDKTIRTII